MYADRVDAQANLSIKERLNGNSAAGSVHRRPTSGKRQREDDDKWEHDLFEENGPRVSNRRVGSKDLRLKLQRKTIEQDLRDKLSGALYSPPIEFQAQPFRLKHVSGGERDLRDKLSGALYSPVSGGARDLRDKLSGALYSHPIEFQPQSVRTKSASEVSKPPRISVKTEAPGRETKNIARSVSKKKAQQKVETVDSFLQSLGLEKYAITFQAEEVDMTALVHMGDEDLKAMGVPMGPRKKILLALESKV